MPTITHFSIKSFFIQNYWPNQCINNFIKMNSLRKDHSHDFLIHGALYKNSELRTMEYIMVERVATIFYHRNFMSPFLIKS